MEIKCKYFNNPLSNNSLASASVSSSLDTEGNDELVIICRSELKQKVYNATLQISAFGLPGGVCGINVKAKFRLEYPR